VAALVSLASGAWAADGDLVWAKRVGGPDRDLGVRIALDSTFKRYVTGGFSATVDFDPDAGVFNLTSPNPVTNEEFGKTIGRTMKRPHYFPLPSN
jgi:hypothetical protein